MKKSYEETLGGNWRTSAGLFIKTGESRAGSGGTEIEPGKVKGPEDPEPSPFQLWKVRPQPTAYHRVGIGKHPYRTRYTCIVLR